MPPTDLNRPSRLITLAAICVVVAALYLASAILIPLALAVLFTFLLTPLVRRLERLRIPRVPSVLIVVLGALVIFGFLAFVVGDQVVQLANNIESYQDNIMAKLDVLRPRPGVLEKFSRFGEKVQKNLERPATTQSTQAAVAANEAGVSPESSQRVAPYPRPNAQPSDEQPLPVVVVNPKTSPTALLWGYLGLALSPLATAGLVIVFVLFMLLQREDLRDRVIRLVGYGQLTLTTQALDDAAARISRYLMMQALVNGSYGITIAIGLWVIGKTAGHSDPAFPNVVLWGLLCAVLRFVPYIGPWIAAAFPVLISLAVYKGFGVFGWTVGLFVVVELLSNNILEPLLYGASTGLSTVAILIAALFWTWLWGPIGLVMALPLTVCLIVIGKYVPQLGFLDILLGDQPVLAPHERIYQRWLAMDQEEAAELATGYLGERSLEEIYDTMLLPALAMAEVDHHKGILDESRQIFIHRALRELIDELGDEQQVLLTRTGATTADQPDEMQASEGSLKRRGHLPVGCEVNLLTLPAHDEADEIVGLMLSQLLSFQGYCATGVSVTSLASEMIDQIGQTDARLIAISAVPPGAATHSRYLCKRIHARYPRIPILVGLWSHSGNLERARQRITCAADAPIVTTLADALDQIEQLIRPLILRSSEAAKEADSSATSPSSPQPRP